MNNTDKAAVYFFIATALATTATVLNGDGAEFGKEVLPIIVVFYFALAFIQAAKPIAAKYRGGDSA